MKSSIHLKINPQQWQSFSIEQRLVYAECIVNSEDDDLASEIISQMSFNDKKTKSVTILLTSLSSGGAERNCVNVGNLLKKEGYNVQLIYFYDSDHNYPVSTGISTLRIGLSDSNRYRKIYDACIENKTDTVVLPNHWLYQNFKDIFWFKLMGFRVIAQEHNNFYYPIYAGSDLSLINKRRRAYKVVDKLTCLSQMDRELWKLSGIKEVIYLPNLSNVKRESLNFDERENAVLVLSRMTVLKGSDRLSRIILQVLAKTHETKFYLVGNFPSKFKKELFKLRLKIMLKEKYKYVQLLNFTSNPEEFIRRVRCLLIPSYVEGSPMVICEARAKGTPVVIQGMNYIDNAGNGVLHVKSGPVENFSQAISTILSDYSTWEKYSKESAYGLNLWLDESVREKWLQLLDFQTDFSTQPTESLQRSLNNLREAMEEFYAMVGYLDSHKLYVLLRMISSWIRKK